MKIIRPVRVLLVIISIGLALYAQSTIKNHVLGAATLPLFAGAIALAVLASIGLPALPLAQPNAPAFEKLGKQYLIGMAVAFVLMVLGVLEFLKGAAPEDSSPTGWIFYALSMLVFGLAFIPFGRMLSRGKTGHSAAVTISRADKVERVIAIALFVALAGAALLVRMNLLNEFPDGVWFDEGANGLVALKMIQDPAYRPLYVDVTQMPAHFNFIIAFLFQIFGANIGAVRLAPTIFGVAAVAFTFLLFRRWFNTPIAIFAAAMFAVMRYSLTFSRFGLNGHVNVTMIVISLYFLDRAVRNKKFLDFALAGLVIGFGLNFYYAFRLFAAVVFGFAGLCVLVWLVLRMMRRDSSAQPIRTVARGWMLPSLVLIFGLIVAIAPVIQFAARNPEQFFIRTSTVSIFEKRDEPDLRVALSKNITKHLLMWNVSGDGNGRHNLPGEPMLDPVMGALAVVGVGYAVARAHRARNFLMLILFVGMLMGGILSVDFEAPQAYRSNGTMPSIIYFATLPIALLFQTIQQGLTRENIRKIGYVAGGLVGVVLLFNIAQYNLDTFFNRQRNSGSTWIVQSPGETFAGREMKRLAKDYDLVVSSHFANHPSQKFEAPNVNNFKIFTPNDLLVFGDDSSRGVAYLLDGSLKSTYQLLKKYFPTAQFVELVPPDGGEAVAYSVAISPEDIKQLIGVDVWIYDNDSFSGSPHKSQPLNTFLADWASAPPADLLTSGKAVEFKASLYVPQYGLYKLVMRGTPGAEIFIDEFVVKPEGMNLGRGNHSLRVRLTSASARGKFDLAWQGPGISQLQTIPSSALLREPVTNNGLLGSYYRSPDWSGEPAFTQIDPEVAFYFHNLPLPRPYTVEWKGKVLAAQTGAYEFATMSIDESLLSVDGKQIVNNTQKGAIVGGVVQLEAGWHDIVMRFGDRTGYTQAYLYWTPPNGVREIIPSNKLLPPMGNYPTAEEMQKILVSRAPVIKRTSKSGDTGTMKVELFGVPTRVPEMPVSKPVELTQPAPVAVSSAKPADNAPTKNAPVLKAQSVALVGEQGNGDGQFLNPRAVRIGKNGRIFVADTGNARVQILAEDGAFVKSIAGPENARFGEPIDIQIVKDEVFVLDDQKPILYKFDQDGKYLGQIEMKGASMYMQRGFAIDKTGNIFVANTGGGQIVKFSPSGDMLQIIGEHGSGRGQLSEPNSVMVAEDGVIYAIDAQAGRVLLFDAEGKYQSDFPIAAASPAVGPRAIIASDGSILMTATEPHLIQRFSKSGELLAQMGGFGTEAGAFRQPTGIDLKDDVIWIAETGNNRLQKLKLTK